MSLKSLKYPPTDEQSAIRRSTAEMIDKRRTALAVNAGAGTGKTTAGLYLTETVIPNTQSLAFVCFNRDPKEEIAAKLRDLGIHPKARAKTFNGLAYTAFFNKFKIDYDQGNTVVDIDDGKYRAISRYLILTTGYLKRAAQMGVNPHDAEMEAVNMLTALINFWQVNTTIDSTRPANEWVLQHYTGGYINQGALEDWEPTNTDLIDRMARRYGLSLTEYPEGQPDLYPLVDKALTLGEKALTDGQTIAGEIDDALEEAGRPGSYMVGLSPAVKYWVTFADMEYFTVIRNWPIRYKYMWIIADEAQDMSPLDRALIQKYRYARKDKYLGKVIVIGDPAQAIYMFRGADWNGFYNSKSFWFIGKDSSLTLSVSHRVPKCVARLAEQYKPGYQAADSNAEGEAAHINLDDLVALVKPGDALISRTKAELIQYWRRLVIAGIPARIKSDDLIEPILAMMEKVTKLEGFRWSSVNDYVRKHGEIEQMKLEGKPRTGERIKNLRDQIELLCYLTDAFPAPSADQWMELIRTKLDPNQQPSGEAVMITTAHSCKGLEFPRVFIITPDKFPLIFDDQTQEELGQEYNLKYVAITRAKEALYYVRDTNRSYLKLKAEGREQEAFIQPIEKASLEETRQPEPFYTLPIDVWSVEYRYNVPPGEDWLNYVPDTESPKPLTSLEKAALARNGQEATPELKPEPAPRATGNLNQDMQAHKAREEKLRGMIKNFQKKDDLKLLLRLITEQLAELESEEAPA